MRLSTIIKGLPVPAMLAGGLYAAATGDLPVIAGAVDGLLAKFDAYIFQSVAHPAIFLVFSGLTIAWVIYMIIKLAIFKRREHALVNLGKVWEDGTTFRNNAMMRPPITQDDMATMKQFEETILRNVAVISKPRLGFFKKINTYNEADHPPEVHPSIQENKKLIIFSERLRRVGKFIEVYTRAD